MSARDESSIDLKGEGENDKAKTERKRERDRERKNATKIQLKIRRTSDTSCLDVIRSFEAGVAFDSASQRVGSNASPVAVGEWFQLIFQASCFASSQSAIVFAIRHAETQIRPLQDGAGVARQLTGAENFGRYYLIME